MNVRFNILLLLIIIIKCRVRESHLISAIIDNLFDLKMIFREISIYLHFLLPGFLLFFKHNVWNEWKLTYIWEGFFQRIATTMGINITFITIG